MDRIRIRSAQWKQCQQDGHNRSHSGRALAAATSLLVLIMSIRLSCSAEHSQRLPRSPRVLKRLQGFSREAFASSLPEREVPMTMDSSGDDPLNMFRQLLTGPGFDELLKHPDMLSRILEEFPLLSSLESFKSASVAAARESPTTLGESFRRGMGELLALMETASGSELKDPTHMTKRATDTLVSARTDPDMQDLIRRARGGDVESARAIRDKLADVLTPGIDSRAFKVAIDKYDVHKLVEIPEVMHYVDQDATMSALVRGSLTTTPEALLQWIDQREEEQLQP